MKDTFYKEYVQSLIKIATKHLNNGFTFEVEEELRRYFFISKNNEITFFFKENGEEPQVSILWYATKSRYRTFELDYEDGIDYSFYEKIAFEKIIRNIKTKIEIRNIFIKNRN